MGARLTPREVTERLGASAKNLYNWCARRELDDPPAIKTSGSALRVLREEAGLTVREVAQRAGVSKSYLSRVENGAVEPSGPWIGNVASTIAAALVDAAVARSATQVPEAVAS